MGMPLMSVRESENSFDSNAIKVVVPPLHLIQLDILDCVVGKRVDSETVREIAGRDVGRIHTATLATILSPYIDANKIRQMQYLI